MSRQVNTRFAYRIRLLLEIAKPSTPINENKLCNIFMRKENDENIDMFLSSLKSENWGAIKDFKQNKIDILKAII